MAGGALRPALASARRLDRRDAPLERRVARRAPRDRPDARALGGGQLERRALVVAPRAEVDGVAHALDLLHAEDVDEEVDGSRQVRRQELDAAEVRDVVDGLRHDASTCGPRRRLEARDPARVRDGHRADLLVGEAVGEERVGHQREAVLDGRVRVLAEVGRPHRLLRPHRARRLEDALPRDLARVGRREGALHHRAHAGKLDLIVRRDRLRGELRMRHDDVADASFGRGLDEPEDLVAAEVAGAEDEAVTRDDVEHLVGLGQQRPSLVDDRHGRAHEAGLAEGELERDPDGHLLVRACPQHLVLLVDRRDGREPHDPGALPRRDLDGERVQPADGAIERDRPQHDDAGDCGCHDLRPFGRRAVVGLEAEPRLAGLEAAPGELDVGDAPGDEVRRDVDVVVDRAPNQRARALARRRMAVSGCTVITHHVCRSAGDAPVIAAQEGVRPRARPGQGVVLDDDGAVEHLVGLAVRLGGLLGRVRDPADRTGRGSIRGTRRGRRSGASSAKAAACTLLRRSRPRGHAKSFGDLRPREGGRGRSRVRRASGSTRTRPRAGRRSRSRSGRG